MDRESNGEEGCEQYPPGMAWQGRLIHLGSLLQLWFPTQDWACHCSIVEGGEAVGVPLFPEEL